MSIRHKYTGIAAGLALALGAAWSALLWCYLWPGLRPGPAGGGAPAAISLARGILVSAVATVLCALVAGAVAWWLSGALHRPIIALIASAHSAAGGAPAAAPAAVQGDEIAALVQAFDTMMERFAARHAECVRSGRTLAQRTAEVGTLNTLTTSALCAASPDDLLRRAMPDVWSALGAQHGEVLMWDEDVAEFRTVLSHGSGAIPGAAEAATGARQRGRPVVLPGEGVSPLPSATPSDVIAVPLATGDRFVGAIVALSERPGGPVPSGVFLNSLALQLHVALERVSLWQETRELGEMRRKLLEATITAQEDERARVARELHDATGQELTSLLLALRSLELSVEGSDARVLVSEIRELATAVLTTVRSLCTELMPRGLEELGLGDALALYVREFEQRHSIAVDYEVTGDCQRLPSHEVQLALYRIVQEALTNVARHAQATRASVTLTLRGGDVVAIVEDNGIGISEKPTGPDAHSRPHLGLFGMQERAELLGGKVTVEGTPGGGTTVYASVPLKPPDTSRSDTGQCGPGVVFAEQ